MYLADTHAELLSNGTLCFRIPGWTRTCYLLEPWERGFTSVCDRNTHRFPAIAWSVAPIPPAGAICAPNPIVDRFVASVPPEMRARVQPYQYGQCLLLSLLAASREARDLAESSPHLFWLLAVAVNEGRIRAGQIAALCRMKQAEILRTLTGTGSKAQVKVLRKVRVAKGTMALGRYLLQAAGNPAIVHALRHQPEIPIALVCMLTLCPDLAREKFVPAIAAQLKAGANAGPEHLIRLYGELCYLKEMQDVLTARSFHVRLEEGMCEQRRRERFLRYATYSRPTEAAAGPLEFPPPPLPGSETIVPITTAEELDAEHRAQQHCVAQYAASVSAGDVYFYRVLAPERGTLAIDLIGGVPEIGEFRLARNGTPSRAAVDAVEAWFAAACRGQRKADSAELPSS